MLILSLESPGRFGAGKPVGQPKQLDVTLAEGQRERGPFLVAQPIDPALHPSQL